LQNRADINKPLDNITRENAAIFAYAIMSIIIADNELTNIILSKRFEKFVLQNFEPNVNIIKSLISENLIPCQTPYDLAEAIIENLKKWNSNVDDIKHVLNIFQLYY